MTPHYDAINLFLMNSIANYSPLGGGMNGTHFLLAKNRLLCVSNYVW